MKRSPLLHAELSHVIASMGHGQVDAARGVPGISDVLKAVLSEMQVEAIVVADEALQGDAKALPGWYPQSLGIAPQTVPHEEFTRRTAKARAMVRTGECTPYANIVLCAGVTF